MSEPLVSVVMPVRDGARFIEAAVRSILSQAFAGFELLIVDDGSTDATPELIGEFATGDGRVRALAGEGRGVARALNLGVQAARGALLARMDADDIALPDRLAAQVAYLADNEKTAVVGSAYRVIDAVGAVLREVTPPTSPEDIRAGLQDGNCLAHPTVMMRRDAVLAIGGFRPQFIGCEDYDLWLRLVERFDLANLAVPLLMYREHAAQATWRTLERRLICEVAALRSAELRRSGADDVFTSIDVIDEKSLLGGGLSQTQLREMLFDRAIAAARSSLAADRVNQAIEALFIARVNAPPDARRAWRFARLTMKARLRGVFARRQGRP